jgi:protein-L-isoaspartate(D-aspartate) O-methyltransferase
MYARYRGMLRKWKVPPLVWFSITLSVSIIGILACEKAGPISAPTRASQPPPPDTNQPGRADPNDPNDKKPLRSLHNHPAFKERLKERERMVAAQIQARGVKDPNVLKAMRTVPRHALIPADQQPYAYADQPRPIGEGQTISQPYIVAFMTEALKLDPNCIVLEIGTGSGYQAAVCAEIAREIYTIEIVPELAESAAKQLKKLGYRNIFVKTGDGYFGWPEKAPFDAIIGTAAAGRIPQPLLNQLKPGGRMILPLRGTLGYEYLELIVKDKKGKIKRTKVMPVRFVLMTGQAQKPEKKSGKN